MKNLLKSALLFIIAPNLFAQGIDDSTSMNALYTNQVFYSLENGEVLNITNEDWNIAFSLSGEGALGSSILLNEATSNLWFAPYDTSYWSSFDTTGSTSWEEVLNSDTSWTNGAFNKYRGAAGFFDLGWGLLDPSNNYWTFGDSLYLIKLGNGSFKKLWINSLKTGVWTFTYADLDGTNEITNSITKSDYPNKNFIYFSIENNTIIDREPDKNTWDILFVKHRDEVAPGMIVPVTSVFNNIGLWTARSDETDLAAALNATSPQTPFNQNVVNIGRTWKKYSGGIWTVYDSIAYFAWNIDSSGFYRIVFTGFGGMGTGKSYFNVNKLGTVAIETYGNAEEHSIYPNPARDIITLKFPLANEEPMEFLLFNLNGDILLRKTGIHDTETWNIEGLPAGVYIYQIIGNEYNGQGKIIKQ